MFLPQKWRLCVSAFAVSGLVLSLRAEIHEIRVYHGKKVDCMRGGFSSLTGADCGTHGYTRVFTGTVRSAVDEGDFSKRLELIPDEVFVGDKNEVTATVTQACLPENEPEITSGDKWLFYVRPKTYWDGKTPYTRTDGLEVPFYSPSKPVSAAQDDIATLRHLAKLTDNGILRGSVIRIGATYDKLDPMPVANHKVIAKSQSTSAEYSAFTNLNGRFEMEIPPGSYDLTAATQQGFREEEPRTPKTILLELGIKGNAFVRQSRCTDVDFTLLVDGKLGGRVIMSDGRPAPFIKVAIIPVSPVHPQFTVETDENGSFEVGGRQPGQYLVGVGLLAPYDSAEWKSRVYYPGVPTREQAKVIELGDGEWRTDIDFRVTNLAIH